MRSTPDFQLYTDLRLAGSNMIGVLHAAEAIDAVQRFISRLDIGMIPSVVDTIIFMKSGEIEKVLNLKMLVKVPSGMTESDLARPIVEVRDELTNNLDYEIYTYGEQTVVIPISNTSTKSSGALKLAEREIENFFSKYSKSVQVEVLSTNKAVVYVPENKISKIIGQAGKNITQCEKDLGMSIDIRELKEEKNQADFDLEENKKNYIFCVDPGTSIEIYAGNKFITSAISSKKGEVKINKNSLQGKDITKALHKKIKIEVKA
jgi:ATPase